MSAPERGSPEALQTAFEAVANALAPNQVGMIAVTTIGSKGTPDVVEAWVTHDVSGRVYAMAAHTVLEAASGAMTECKCATCQAGLDALAILTAAFRESRTCH